MYFYIHPASVSPSVKAVANSLKDLGTEDMQVINQDVSRAEGRGRTQLWQVHTIIQLRGGLTCPKVSPQLLSTLPTVTTLSLVKQLKENIKGHIL